MITLGSEVQDRLTGIKGTAIARTTWLNGCVRITIQPKGHKDGKALETHSQDEEDVIVLKEVKVKAKPSGGPYPSPRRQPDPFNR